MFVQHTNGGVNCTDVRTTYIVRGKTKCKNLSHSVRCKRRRRKLMAVVLICTPTAYLLVQVTEFRRVGEDSTYCTRHVSKPRPRTEC